MTDGQGKGAPRGERNGKAKLKEAQVLQIRRAVAQGQDVQALAWSFGVGRSTIYDIVQRVTWAWLEAADAD